MVYTKAIDENGERLTLDHKYTERELEEIIDEQCATVVALWINKNSKRFIGDISNILPDNVADKVKCENDLIFVYNSEYDKHRAERRFGIDCFCEWFEKSATRILNRNLIRKRDKIEIAKSINEEKCDDWWKH